MAENKETNPKRSSAPTTAAEKRKPQPPGSSKGKRGAGREKTYIGPEYFIFRSEDQRPSEYVVWNSEEPVHAVVDPSGQQQVRDARRRIEEYMLRIGRLGWIESEQGAGKEALRGAFIGSFVPNVTEGTDAKQQSELNSQIGDNEKEMTQSDFEAGAINFCLDRIQSDVNEMREAVSAAISKLEANGR
jgi:hypothetical protein